MEPAGFRQGQQLRVGRRIPEEEREPFRQGVVVESARLILEIEETRRRQHRGVARDHGLREGTARLEGVLHERQETDFLLRRDGAAIGLLHEAAQEALCVLGDVVRGDLDLERRGGGLLHREVREELLVGGGWPGVDQRAFDFDPAHDEARLTVLFGQGVLPAAGPRARPEETHGVHLDRFARLELHVEVRDGDVRIEVDVADAPQHARRRQRIDGDGLGPTALGDLVEVRDEPFFGVARADPDGVPAELEPIATRGRGLEVRELRLDGLIRAGDDADALELALSRVRLADGDRRLARPDFGLRGEAQGREGRAFRRLIEDRELHRPGVAALVAGVVALAGDRKLLGIGDQHLTQRVLRRADVAGQLDVRDVEGFARLVEAMRLGVFRQRLTDVEPRRAQEVAQGVLVFETVEATLHRAAFPADARVFSGLQSLLQLREVTGGGGRVGPRLLHGRHFARSDLVVDLHPLGKNLRLGQVGLERRQVEVAFLGLGVVAFHAVLVQQRRDGRVGHGDQGGGQE